MSDRVAIIGGGTPGRDHFPYPNVVRSLDSIQVPTETGDYTSWPLTPDLSNACRWYYLVKKWRFVLNINYNINLTGPSQTAYSGALQVDVQEKVANGVDELFSPSSEAEFACCDRSQGGFLDFVAGDSGPEETDPGSGVGSLDYSNYSSTLNSSDDPLGPVDIIITLSLAFGFPTWWDDTFAFAFGLSFRDSADLFEASSIFGIGTLLGNCTVDSSRDVPINWSYLDSFEEGQYAYHYLNSFSASLTPVEFWSYAARDGSPIYDTSTGAQLQDPLGDGVKHETITQNNGGTPQTANVLTDEDPWVAV